MADAFRARASRRVLITSAAAVVAVSGLLGCAGGDIDPTPNQTAAATQSGPDPEALLERLGAIDPALADEAAVDAADEVCLALERGEDDAAVEETARAAFGDLAESTLTEEQIASIVETVKGDYCG
jgi:hypothetical protein